MRRFFSWFTGKNDSLSYSRAKFEELSAAYQLALAERAQIITDLTKQKQEALKIMQDTLKAEERFKLVIEAAPNAMIMVNQRGQITLVNRQTETLFGYSRNELSGQLIELLIPERYRAHHPNHRNAFFSRPSTRSMGAGRDLFGQRKDGSEVPIEIGLNPIETAEGIFTLAAIIDITERKKSEENLKKSAAELEQRVAERTHDLEESRQAAIKLTEEAIRAKEKVEKRERELAQKAKALAQSNQDLAQFSYIVSHDLQEPLRKIISFIDILKEDLQDKLDEESKKNMSYVVGGAERMSNLIQDLLEFSRVGRKELQRQKIDITKMVDDVLFTLTGILQEKKASVNCHGLSTIHSVSPLVSQVFQNLIGNAIKFCPPDRLPCVHIKATDRDDDWLFCVEDNGIGIESEYLKKIFNVFQRLHTRAAYPGTGIGLAICKKIIERHGGKIWAESKPGEGTNFFFTIPKNREVDFYDTPESHQNVSHDDNSTSSRF